MALEGTLKDFSFADILQLISLQRKNGVLTLKHHGEVVTISFLDGRIAGADSLTQHLEDRLGLILLKADKLTDQELDAALRKQEQSLQRLGRILIEHHIVHRDDVRGALEQQILQIIYRVFRWNDGDYHFSQETDIDYDKELFEPIPADSIIMEGARMTDEWPFIDKKLPPRQSVLVHSDPDRVFEVDSEEEEDFDFDFGFGDEEPKEKAPPKKEEPSDALSETQYHIYRLINGRDDIAEVILASPVIEFETCKALTELLGSGAVRLARPDEIRLRPSNAPAEHEPVSSKIEAAPWLVLPILGLLGFSVVVMPNNPVNPAFSTTHRPTDQVREASSWYRLQSLWQIVESANLLEGGYPASLEEMVHKGYLEEGEAKDPWGHQYRLTVRSGSLTLVGTDSKELPDPKLLLSHAAAPGGAVGSGLEDDAQGVVFID